VRQAWRFAFGWGIVSLLIAVTQPLWGEKTPSGVEQAFGMWLAGLIVIVISLAVRRGSRIAAWGLVGYAVLDAVSRLASGIGGVLIPFVLFVLALPAALQLQRSGSKSDERRAWPRLLYEVAFLQAAITGLFVLWSFFVSPTVLREITSFRVNPWFLLDVAILTGLGFAAFKRNVWAGYALVLYECANAYGALIRGSQLIDFVAPAILVILYVVGAIQLHREQGRLTWPGRAAVAVVAGLVLLNLGWVATKRPTPFERVAQENEARLAAVPGLRERFEANPKIAKALGKELALKGARRLTDAQLVDRARVLSLILARLDEHNCAEQLRGGRGEIAGALNQLDDATLRAWMDLAFIAMVAEHLNVPDTQAAPSEEEVNKAFEKFLDSLSPDDAARFVRVANEGGDSYNQASDADACWAFRTMVNAVPKLDPSSQRTFARMLVAQ
jgi:hypothetical protein